jgi:hypothetical protein
MPRPISIVIYVTLLPVLFANSGVALSQGTGPFLGEPILSRPTAHSVLLTVLPLENLSIFCEWGTSSSGYSYRSDTLRATPSVPLSLQLIDLTPDTRYFYQVRWKPAGTESFSSGPQHSFSTQRARGSAFTFTMEADPHPYDKKGSHTLWYRTMENQRVDSADFLLDLGDTFGDDHQAATITDAEIRQLRLDCLPFFAAVCHSSPLFLCEGNHEGENGFYLLETPPANLAARATLWRKYYYPNPIPDDFYSGNTETEPFGIEHPENYYAWEWGDALFVVMDVYRYYTANEKPGGWDWTIGRTQYDWLKRTLETSTARFKFVIAHHTRGQGRGGIVTAHGFEWGGYETDGVTWGFTGKRPGWAMPIHQLMVTNGVSVFFQGHDHLFAKEELDGVIYQEVPMPSDSTYIIGVRDNGDSYTGVTLDGAGHIRVRVTPDSAKVDYVRSYLPADENATHVHREIAYSYKLLPRVTAIAERPTMPANFGLEQNYPNPFNPATTIRYTVPVSGPVSLRVYDVMGREVARPVDGFNDAGPHTIVWDAPGMASGVYMYRLTAPGTSVARTALLVK